MSSEKIIVLYERLSREDENLGESYSISNQKKLLEDYCREKGWTRFRHFTDDGISGTTFDRPSFKAMIQLVEDGEVETIILKDMSRLGRDYLVVGQLREFFRKKGVRLIAINDNHDSYNGDDDFLVFRDVMNEMYRLILMNDPNLQGAFRLNMFTDKIDITRDLGWYRESDSLTDVDLKFLVVYLEKHYGLSNEKRIEDVIKVVANENRYHPVLDRINSITWDGWERIRYALHHFLGAEVSEYTYEVMKLFMIGTIARISCPGIKFEVMLCLVGGQGAGKSTFLRFLAMEDDWFTDDLKKMDDDNVYRKIQGHLIIEFPEMVAILNAKNVEDTKSFMSRQKDTYKTPYDRHPKDHKRQCVFAGSSNSLDFLPMDRSGNRRFLPILCNMEEAETHILDDEKTSREYIDQMWAEAMEIYRSGKCQLRLPKEMEKELCEYQKQFMQEDTKKELILDYLEHYEGSMVCSRQLYSEALGNDGNPAQWEIREINDIMNNCSNWIAFSNPRHFPEPYRRQKGWEKPDNRGQDFQPITKEQMEQLSLPPEWMER